MAVAESSAKRSSKTFSVMGSAAKSAGLLVGVAGLGAGLKVAVSEFREAQKVGAQTTAVLKSTGGAAKVTKKQIEDLAGAISKKTGIDDEAIQASENLLLTFTKIRNETGKGNQIFSQATQVVTDMSVALGQSGKSSAIQLGKALQDPIKGITALRRVGVNFNAQQSEQIKKMVESGHLLEAQRTILRELTTEFGGSAAAQATAGDKLKVSLNNLAEVVGGALVPQLDKAAVALTNLINDFVEGKGIATTVIPVVVSVRNAIASVIPPVVALGAAVQNVATKLGPVFSVVAAGWRIALGGFVQWLRGWVELFTAILTGDFGKAWRSLKGIVSGAIQGVIGVVQVQTAGIRAIAGQMGKALTSGFKGALNLAHELAVSMRDLIAKAPGYALGVGKAIIRGIIDGIKSAAGGIGDAIGKAAKGAIPKLPDLNPFGEGLGASSIVPVKGGGNLMGARASMGPFAAVGAANGLHVSSGLRKGAITSSGNTSYHSTGEAVDLAGSPAGMMKTFKTLRSKFGSRLAELIYTPGGAGIKNGKSNVYTGQVAADHFDHVHVAYDTGMPGVGDGLGRARSAAAIALGDGPGKSVETFRSLAARVWSKATALMQSPGAMPPIGFAPQLSGGHNYAHFNPANGRITISEAMLAAIRNANDPNHDYALESLVHEYAHARQRSDVISGDRRATEGGAEIFAARMTPGIMKVLGVPYNGNYPHAYEDEQAWTYKNKGAKWWKFGQFAHVATGSVSKTGLLAAPSPNKLGGTQLANLWVRAGGDPKLAGLMARIAMAESGGDPSAHNPSGATGLWQILGAMVKGNLTNPLVNAKNAVAKYKAQGLGAWAASRGAWGKYVGHPGIKAGKAATKGAAAAKVNPFDLAIAKADIAIADAPTVPVIKSGVLNSGKPVVKSKATAILAKQKIVGARIRSIRRALKKKLTPATRLRLTQELGQLLPQHVQLGLDRQEALAGPAATDVGAADVGGGVDTGPEGDPNQPLIDAIAAATAAETEHTAAVRSLQDAINAQNAIAGSTLGIGLKEAQRALADMIANQLGSYGGTAGRALTAGSGTVVRY